MFDRLVESARQNEGRHAGRYLLVTSLIYVATLALFTSLAVMGFSPALAENLFLVSKLPQPPLLAAELPKEMSYKKSGTPNRIIFRQPKILPDTSLIPHRINLMADRFNDYALIGTKIGLNGNGPAETAPPEPPAPPAPPRKIEPAPEVKPGPSRVSEGVLQGIAIKKVKPSYPVIAKQVHAGGSVQVQVTIAEDGHVLEANIISGNSLLRNAALEAARQWLFSPTTLGKVPVKVQGILTFNFVLE
ncbi:MAG: energy transducer TonB [Blastocatellia bacterium]|nr:energy transducer TonB [Blastocatellia bacterium]